MRQISSKESDRRLTERPRPSSMEAWPALSSSACLVVLAVRRVTAAETVSASGVHLALMRISSARMADISSSLRTSSLGDLLRETFPGDRALPV